MKLVVIKDETKIYTMKNTFTISMLIILGGFLISCQQKNKTHSASDDSQDSIAITVEHPIENYSYTQKGDTIQLSICDTSGRIVGDLVYKLREKDSNTGKISGSFQDSLLIAEYTFNSEGITSIRQVVFKKVHDGFVEGFGEVIDDNGKFVFKDIHGLDYSNSYTLTRQ